MWYNKCNALWCETEAHDSHRGPKSDPGGFVMPPKPRRIEDRFWEKVNKNTENGCWEWFAGKRADGYATLWINGKHEYAHRLSYVWAKGKIPSNLVIDHLCRNPSCVNPDHLETVTKGENNMRGAGSPAILAKKTICLRGHPFDLFNTYYRPDGKGRNCRECIRIRQQADTAQDPLRERMAR